MQSFSYRECYVYPNPFNTADVCSVAKAINSKEETLVITEKLKPKGNLVKDVWELCDHTQFPVLKNSTVKARSYLDQPICVNRCIG